METQIRQVTSSTELDQLYRFRYQIYVDEVQFTQHADHQKKELKDACDEVGHHFAIFEGDRILGSLRILFMNEVPSVETFISKFNMQNALKTFGAHSICTTSRFMIDPSLRNGKAIFKLMREAYRFGIERGARLNYGDCSPHLVPFYEHMGYRRYSDGFNDSHFGYKIPILMLIRDHLFFYEVRSLLYRLAKNQPDDEEARFWFQNSYPDYVKTRSSVFLEEQAFLDLLTERLAKDPVHHVSLLQGLNQTEAQRFLAEATLFPMKPGDLVIRKGDSDASVYVLLKGLAQVVQELNGKPIATLGAGDTFGEMGFLTTSPRSAHVVAKTEGEVLVMTSDFMDRFIRQQPEIASKILLNLAKELAARLAMSNQFHEGSS